MNHGRKCRRASQDPQNNRNRLEWQLRVIQTLTVLCCWCEEDSENPATADYLVVLHDLLKSEVEFTLSLIGEDE